MQRFVYSAAILAFSLWLPVSSMADDELIARQVMQKLQQQKKSGKLKGFSLDLKVEGGTVILEGRVSKPEQRTAILDAARRVPGVTQVVNGIEVGNAAPTVVPQVGQNAPRATAVTQKAEPTEVPKAKSIPIDIPTRPPVLAPVNPLVEQASNETSQKKPSAEPQVARQVARTTTPEPVQQPVTPARQKVDDQVIAQIITAQLKTLKDSGQLRGFGINMQVDKGTVWLKGRVSSDEQQALVLDVARRVGGVEQVINDLEIKPAKQRTVRPNTPEPVVNDASLKKMFQPPAAQGKSVVKSRSVTPAGTEALGSGVRQVSKQHVGTRRETQPAAAVQPLYEPTPAQMPVMAQPMMVPPGMAHPMMAQRPSPYVSVNHGGGQVPLAFAPSTAGGGAGAGSASGGPGMAGMRMPAHLPGSGAGVVPAQYDHPQMPGYAWPSYASHPNYGAVTYPKQYSPTAWPYIGPFYPYPQVPLGWRRVELKWKDGWWQLDFKDKY